MLSLIQPPLPVFTISLKLHLAKPKQTFFFLPDFRVPVIPMSHLQHKNSIPSLDAITEPSLPFINLVNTHSAFVRCQAVWQMPSKGEQNPTRSLPSDTESLAEQSNNHKNKCNQDCAKYHRRKVNSIKRTCSRETWCAA